MRHTALLSLAAVFVLTPAPAAVVVGAGYSRPTPVTIAPGQIITFYVQGIGRDLTTRVQAGSLPLPTSLAGISATFVQGTFTALMPVLSVEPVSPCAYPTDPGCSSTYVAVKVQLLPAFDFSDPTVFRGAPVLPAQAQFSENDVLAATVDLIPVSDQIHLLRPCDDSWPNIGCPATVTHADGSEVTFAGPARGGETVVLYGVGLGTPSSPVPSGQSPAAPVPTPVLVSFDWTPNSLGSRPPGTTGSKPAFAGLIPGYVGLYQINVVIPTPPAGIPPCDGAPTGVFSNLTINVAGHSSFDGARLCVEP